MSEKRTPEREIRDNKIDQARTLDDQEEGVKWAPLPETDVIDGQVVDVGYDPAQLAEHERQSRIEERRALPDVDKPQVDDRPAVASLGDRTAPDGVDEPQVDDRPVSPSLGGRVAPPQVERQPAAPSFEKLVGDKKAKHALRDMFVFKFPFDDVVERAKSYRDGISALIDATAVEPRGSVFDEPESLDRQFIRQGAQGLKYVDNFGRMVLSYAAALGDYENMGRWIGQAPGRYGIGAYDPVMGRLSAEEARARAERFVANARARKFSTQRPYDPLLPPAEETQQWFGGSMDEPGGLLAAFAPGADPLDVVRMAAPMALALTRRYDGMAGLPQQTDMLSPFGFEPPAVTSTSPTVTMGGGWNPAPLSEQDRLSRINERRASPSGPQDASPFMPAVSWSADGASVSLPPTATQWTPTGAASTPQGMTSPAPTGLLGSPETTPLISLSRGGRAAESPADLNRATLIYSDEIPAAEPRSRKLIDIGHELNQEALAAWGGKAPEMVTENAEIIARNMTDEALASLSYRPEMAGWYKDNLSRAMASASEIYPELATDPQAQTAFKFIMAITSNGQKVSTNAGLTNLYYSEYKKLGRFPIRGSGKEREAMEQAFEKANAIVDDEGMDGFIKFLSEDFTVRELRKAGFKVTGELVGTVVKGSVIFGPKIGGGFMQNLLGNYNPATFDRWWMRTFGRHTGTLIATPQKVANQREELRGAIGRKRKIVEEFGFDPDVIKDDDEALDLFAQAVFKSFEADNFKNKTPVNNAARNLAKSLSNLVDAPAGGKQRMFMREIIGLVQRNMAEQGVEVDIADVQALLWYAEKDLYGKLGAISDTERVDYATVWREIADEARR